MRSPAVRSEPPSTAIAFTPSRVAPGLAGYTGSSNERRSAALLFALVAPPRWRNRFASLGPAFYTRLPAQAAARSALGGDQRRLRRRARLAVRLVDRARRARSLFRRRAFAGHGASGQRVQRPPVRRLGRPTRRRPRAAARRGRVAVRPARAAAQRQRPDAVFAHGRRPRGAALVDPRVPVLRGDALRWAFRRRARCASPARQLPVRRETIETAAVVTRVAPKLHPLRALRALHAHGAGHRRASTAGRFRHRRLLPRMPRQRRAGARAARSGERDAPPSWWRNGRRSASVTA